MSARPIRRRSKRKERLLAAQRAVIVSRPLVLPEGADEELGKLFGIGVAGCPSEVQLSRSDTGSGRTGVEHGGDDAQ